MVKIIYDAKCGQYIARLLGSENFAVGNTAGQAKHVLMRELLKGGRMSRQPQRLGKSYNVVPCRKRDDRGFNENTRKSL